MRRTGRARPHVGSSSRLVAGADPTTLMVMPILCGLFMMLLLLNFCLRNNLWVNRTIVLLVFSSFIFSPALEEVEMEIAVDHALLDSVNGRILEAEGLVVDGGGDGGSATLLGPSLAGALGGTNFPRRDGQMLHSY